MYSQTSESVPIIYTTLSVFLNAPGSNVFMFPWKHKNITWKHENICSLGHGAFRNTTFLTVCTCTALAISKQYRVTLNSTAVDNSSSYSIMDESCQMIGGNPGLSQGPWGHVGGGGAIDMHLCILSLVESN